MEPVGVTPQPYLTTHLSHPQCCTGNHHGGIMELIDYLYAIAGAIYTQISAAFGS